MRRRRKLRKPVKLLCIALVTLLVLLMLIRCAAPMEFKETRYIVCEGDTLWDIYTEYVDGIRWDAWLYEMRKVNDLGSDPILVAGDVITILITE